MKEVGPRGWGGTCLAHPPGSANAEVNPCRYGDCDVVVDRLFSGTTFHLRGRQHGRNQRHAQQQRRQRIPQDLRRRTRGA